LAVLTKTNPAGYLSIKGRAGEPDRVPLSNLGLKLDRIFDKTNPPQADLFRTPRLPTSRLAKAASEALIGPCL
jgi:hypothetical protein